MIGDSPQSIRLTDVPDHGRAVVLRLGLAALAGALATGCGVALLAVSGFLLARASQHPAITALSIAVVSVRALSLGRGGFRYAERLASHDVAFRVLARARVTAWRRLEALAPAGLGRFSSGDLLSRIVADVDATSDLFLRGITPPLAAALAGGGAVLACLALLGPAGLVLAAGLLAGGLGVPVAGLLAARSAARRTSPLRGQFGSALADALAGAADLAAFGAEELALGRIEAANDGLLRASRRSAAAAGIGTGLAALVAGVTTWAVLLLGVAAVQAGTLSRVPLAVLTLTALASFEAVTALPAAAIQLAYARTAARRIAVLTDSPDPVREPDEPLPLPLPLPRIPESTRAGCRRRRRASAQMASSAGPPPGSRSGRSGRAGSTSRTSSPAWWPRPTASPRARVRAPCSSSSRPIGASPPRPARDSPLSRPRPPPATTRSPTSSPRSTRRAPPRSTPGSRPSSRPPTARSPAPASASRPCSTRPSASCSRRPCPPRGRQPGRTRTKSRLPLRGA